MALVEFDAHWSFEKLPNGRRRWSARPESGWTKKPGFFFIGRYAPGDPADQADFSHDQINRLHRIIRLNSPLFPTNEPSSVLALYWAVEVPVVGRGVPRPKVIGISRTKFHTGDERSFSSDVDKPTEEAPIVVANSNDEEEEKEEVPRPPPRRPPPSAIRRTRPSVPMYRWVEDDRPAGERPSAPPMPSQSPSVGCRLFNDAFHR